MDWLIVWLNESSLFWFIKLIREVATIENMLESNSNWPPIGYYPKRSSFHRLTPKSQWSSHVREAGIFLCYALVPGQKKSFEKPEKSRYEGFCVKSEIELNQRLPYEILMIQTWIEKSTWISWQIITSPLRGYNLKRLPSEISTILTWFGMEQLISSFLRQQNQRYNYEIVFE